MPKEIILKDLPLTPHDYELLVEMDDITAQFQHEERQRQRNKQLAERGVHRRSGSFGRGR